MITTDLQLFTSLTLFYSFRKKNSHKFNKSAKEIRTCSSFALLCLCRFYSLLLYRNESTPVRACAFSPPFISRDLALSSRARNQQAAPGLRSLPRLSRHQQSVTSPRCGWTLTAQIGSFHFGLLPVWISMFCRQ